jgi:hypothetical protein
MPSLLLYQFFVASVDGRDVKGGSLTSATSIALSDGELLDQTHKVAPETAVKLFDKTEMETLGAFAFMWLESDLDVLLQITTDVGGGDEYFVLELKGSGTAGKTGPALVLGSDLAHQLDGAVNAFDGTEDTIDEIWAYNASSDNTARVRIVAAT